MNQKQNVRLVGRGAVGLTMGDLLASQPDKVDFAFVVDEKRKARYQSTPLLFNGQPRDFVYESQPQKPADVLLLACKSYSLPEAMELAASWIDDHTILMSALNGISSEQQLQARFPANPVIHTIAQNMDSLYDSKAGTLTFTRRGELVFGAADPGLEGAADTVEALLKACHVPARRSACIEKEQGGKLMANCGLNQLCALYDLGYGEIANDPHWNALFVQAMEETRQVLAAWGRDPGTEVIAAWQKTLPLLQPDSMPSMAQDMKAGRPIELDLFSLKVLEMGKAVGIKTPLLETLAQGLLQKVKSEKLGKVDEVAS